MLSAPSMIVIGDVEHLSMQQLLGLQHQLIELSTKVADILFKKSKEEKHVTKNKGTVLEHRNLPVDNCP